MNQSILNSLCIFAEDMEPQIKNYRLCAAVVYKHKEIISIGYPRRKTHTLQARFSKNPEAIYLHCEVDAIIRALRTTKLNPKDHSVYVARVKQRGPFDFSFVRGLAKPCSGCERFIENCGLTQIKYTV